MNNGNLPHLSRRSFIAAAGLGATVAFVPRLLFAQKEGIVPTMIDGAAKAKIETHPLRRGISVLEGSGGNIAVLTGKDGKLLIDSGFTVSKARLVEALNQHVIPGIKINTDAMARTTQLVQEGFVKISES